jgi:hypothetical protein
MVWSFDLPLAALAAAGERFGDNRAITYSYVEFHIISCAFDLWLEIQIIGVFPVACHLSCAVQVESRYKNASASFIDFNKQV